jgi:hypothetical protein
MNCDVDNVTIQIKHDSVSLLVTSQTEDALLKIRPRDVSLWEKARVEPISARKNVSYVMILPENAVLQTHARTFLRDLTSFYEG